MATCLSCLYYRPDGRKNLGHCFASLPIDGKEEPKTDQARPECHFYKDAAVVRAERLNQKD